MIKKMFAQETWANFRAESWATAGPASLARPRALAGRLRTWAGSVDAAEETLGQGSEGRFLNDRRDCIWTASSLDQKPTSRVPTLFLFAILEGRGRRCRLFGLRSAPLRRADFVLEDLAGVLVASFALSGGALVAAAASASEFWPRRTPGGVWGPIWDPRSSSVLRRFFFLFLCIYRSAAKHRS